MEKSKGRPSGSKNKKTFYREIRSKAFHCRKSFPDIEDELPPFRLPDTLGLKKITREVDEKSKSNDKQDETIKKTNVDAKETEPIDTTSKKSSQNIEDELPPCGLPDTLGLKRISRGVDDKSKNEEVQERLNEVTNTDEVTPVPRRVFSNIFRTSTIRNKVIEKRKDSSLTRIVPPRKYIKLNDSTRIQPSRSKKNQKGVSEESNNQPNVTNKKMEHETSSETEVTFIRAVSNQSTKVSDDISNCSVINEIEESSKTKETYRKKYESCRIMLIKERKRNESKRQSQLKELETLKKQLSESSSTQSKTKSEIDKLKKDNEKLKILLQNSNQIIKKYQDTINELKKLNSEQEIQIEIMNKKIENYDKNQPSLRKGGKTFSRETKLYVFSMLERCISYENIDYTLKRSTKCFLNRELDDCISRRTFYKWTKEFKVCSLCVSGYLLEEFIRKKGKGVLFHGETASKNEKLQTFILCGNAGGVFYEIMLGTVEVKDTSTESTVEIFEKLIDTLAKVTKSFKYKFLQDTYNSIYGYLCDSEKTGKIHYNPLNEIANRGKDPNEIRKYVTNSCVSYIGSNISKTVEKLLHNMSAGQETLNVVRQLSKKLSIKSCVYHLMTIAFEPYNENSRVNEETENLISEPKLTFLVDDNFKIRKIISKNINYFYNEILEFSESIDDSHDICKKILPILQTKEIMNAIVFTSYLHELFIFPIVRAGESTDIRQFLRYMKHLTELMELEKYSKLLDVKKIEEEFGNIYGIFNYETLNILSKMMKKIFEDNSTSFEKKKMVKILKETVEDVKGKFIDVYEKIIGEEDYTGYSIKTQTTIIAEHIFHQIKQNSSKSPYKDVAMRSAQVAASHNRMTEVLEIMNQTDLDEIFDRVKVLTSVVDNEFIDSSESSPKDKVDTCSKVESCEKKNMKQKIIKLLNEQLEAKETIKTMEEINGILEKLSSQSQKEKFLRYQLKLWKEDKKSGIKVPKMENETDKYQRVFKKLEYCVKKFSDSNLGPSINQNCSGFDSENSSDESSGFSYRRTRSSFTS